MKAPQTAEDRAALGQALADLNTKLEWGRLYLQPKSRFIWLSYPRRGAEVRESSKSTDPREAKKCLQRRRDEIGEERQGGRRFVGPKGERVRVGELLDWLEKDYRTRSKDTAQLRAHLWAVREVFGPQKAVALDDQDIQDFIKRRRAGTPARPRKNGTVDRRPKANATINRELQLLGQALRYGVRTYNHPVRDTPKLDERGNVRRDFVDRAQLDRLLPALPEDLRDFTRFAYETSWRKGSIARLTWEQVDWAGMELYLRAEQAKNRQANTLPLAGALHDILRRRWQARTFTREDGTTGLSTLVFHRQGRAVQDIRKAWRTATAAAGCPGFHFHGLCRSGIRNMVRAGIDPTVAQEISGRRTPSIFARYNITSPEDKRRALEQRQAWEAEQPATVNVVPMPTVGHDAR